MLTSIERTRRLIININNPPKNISIGVPSTLSSCHSRIGYDLSNTIFEINKIKKAIQDASSSKTPRIDKINHMPNKK